MEGKKRKERKQRKGNICYMQSCVASSIESTLQFSCLIRTHNIVITKSTGDHGFDNHRFVLSAFF